MYTFIGVHTHSMLENIMRLGCPSNGHWLHILSQLGLCPNPNSKSNEHRMYGPGGGMRGYGRGGGGARAGGARGGGGDRYGRRRYEDGPRGGAEHLARIHGTEEDKVYAI